MRLSLAIAQDTDPTDSQPLSARGEPQITDGETGRIKLDVSDTGFAEHAGTEALAFARDDDIQRRFDNSLELERKKLLAAGAGELRGVFDPLLLEQAFDCAPPFEITHDDEVPWLREADAGGVMGGDEYAREHGVGYRIGPERADVTAAKNRLVEAVARGRGEGVAVALAS